MSLKVKAKVTGLAEFVEDHMEFEVVANLNSWMCRKGGKIKKLRLCFRCLGEGHLGQYCTCTRVCGLNGCKELHHRLLHTDLHHSGDKQYLVSVQAQRVNWNNQQH